ncbi:uncharacterized protein LOC106135059 [Amyelois transitella]|uniref:uncharacterized protein LOC106135059 n=1 Tax=Amyelois transitella TaxID=680683 RepID=UPI00067B73F0|nr:uncharacterized protein LOC106135059 [Amyelois transitella]
MSKPQKGPVVEYINYCKSSFTLTFAIEILGLDIWHDCNEGWLDLGPCFQGIKLQYQLNPGQVFDLDILIWPHVAKIWFGNKYAWVRTWQYLQRRWLAFSIKHLFPVRVVEFQQFTATVNPILGLGSLGTNAKNDKTTEVYLPPLEFGVRRYFAPVIEVEEQIESFMYNIIWNIVTSFIPASFEDGLYDCPYAVEDIRHQDAIIETVQDIILNAPIPKEINEEPEPDIKLRRESKMMKQDKEKKKVEVSKVKFEIKLSGDNILSGIGRIIKFDTVGDRPPELGEIVTLISSFNLPAQDDLPILFINVERLFDIPTDHFIKLKITQLYTRWKIGEEIHDSELQPIKSKNDMKINDHHAVPLHYSDGSEVTARFLDNDFEIQLRGIRPIIFNFNDKPTFFGYLKNDRDFGKKSPPKVQPNEDTDILIAVTKINCRSIAKGLNEFIRGEYPLYPPQTSIEKLQRPTICTNDINAIGLPIKPDLIVQPYIILEAQMTLEVSLGLVGCRLHKLTTSYARLYALINDRDSIVAINKIVSDINKESLENGNRSELLTGFALDTSEIVLFFIEGPKDGAILKVWEYTADFYPAVKPQFCSSARYHTRIYENMVITTVPFLILRMYVPLGVLLACPPIYVRPALPIPTRTALLKMGRLIAGKLRKIPCRVDMPTEPELSSFRLELCVAPRTAPIGKADECARE